MPPAAPLSVFLSYCRRDEALRERLETHLALLRREGRIAIWHDRKIRGGEVWAERVSDHLSYRVRTTPQIDEVSAPGSVEFLSRSNRGCGYCESTP